MHNVMQARGGRVGGAGTPTGERVIVRIDGQTLDVFHETGTERYHVEMIEKIGLETSEAPTGEVFQVVALRHGCRIPVRFEGSEREALEVIITAVRAAS